MGQFFKYLPFKIVSLIMILGLTSCLDILNNDKNGNSSSYVSNISFDSENTGIDCNIPSMIDFGELDSLPELPDPFLPMDGKRITETQGWRCRRAEIGAQAQYFELGEKPQTDPDNVSTSNITDTTMTVTVEENGAEISFDVAINLPSTGEPPYPAMIGVGFSLLNNSDLDSLGVALIQFPSDELAEQNGSSSRGMGKFYEIFGSNHSAGALMAWSWGISRLIDALETSSGTQINNERLGVTGCSRWGKGALVAGAFDERIALTIPQESGAGGAAGWRISKAQFDEGVNVQTLHQIVNENVWFTSDFSEFSYAPEKLPYDHHELMGMVAPRGLFVIENSSIDWLGVKSTYATSVAARNVWQAMGIPNRMGVSQIGGHGHCQLPETQRPEVIAFVERFLLDEESSNTKIVRTDTEGNIDFTKWTPWDTPALE